MYGQFPKETDILKGNNISDSGPFKYAQMFLIPVTYKFECRSLEVFVYLLTILIIIRPDYNYFTDSVQRFSSLSYQ